MYILIFLNSIIRISGFWFGVFLGFFFIPVASEVVDLMLSYNLVLTIL